MSVTIQNVVSELMFIAIAKPINIDITVEYTSVTDLVSVRVMPVGFDYGNTTTEQYRAAKKLSIDVSLKVPGALNTLRDIKAQILELITVGHKVAA